jgi:hypothetical protein
VFFTKVGSKEEGDDNDLEMGFERVAKPVQELFAASN